MGIYTKALNEGALLMSKDAKVIKNKIKEICKNNQVDKSFLSKMSSSNTFDREIKSKTINELKGYFDLFHVGALMKQEITYNGATSCNYYCKCIGIKNNIIMKFKLYFQSFRSYPEIISEVGNYNELIIPKDVIEQAFKFIRDSVDLEITKNKIYVSSNGSLGKLRDYAEKKYPDKIVKSKGDYIKFK